MDPDENISWLRSYLTLMSEDNWKDMKLRCERQLDDLEIEVRTWKERWEAERADHEATMKYCDEHHVDTRA